MATKGIGTTFSFTPSGGSATRVGVLSAISELACDSEMIDVTTLDESSGCRRFIQGARDAGELRLTGFMSKTDAGQLALRSAWQSGAAGTALITFPDGLTASFPALVKTYSIGAAQVDGAVGFSCVLRADGAVTFA
ncbi:MAG: hypothetical protein IJS53_02045 [Clostridia bacterium]|nr:hypothetical protein [Clostridia bacterium]